MRHLAIGRGVLRELNDLRGPMSAVLDHFVAQDRELERYKKKFGALALDSSSEEDEEYEEEEYEESDTEQE